MKKIFLIICLIVAIVFLGNSSVYQKNKNISVQDYSTLDKQKVLELIDKIKNKSEQNTFSFDETVQITKAISAVFDCDLNTYLEIISFGEWLLKSSVFKTIAKEKQIEFIINLAEVYTIENKLHEAIECYEFLLENYVPELQENTHAYELIFLNLSNLYSYFGYKNIEIDYIEKAIKIFEYNRDFVNVDYITAYNNLFYAYSNKKKIIETFECYKVAKEKYIDSNIQYTEPEKLYSEIVYRKMEIIALLCQDKDTLAKQKLNEFYLWKMNGSKTMIDEKNNYLFSIFSTFIDYYFFECKDYVAAKNETIDFLKLLEFYPEFPFYKMIAYSKLAIVSEKLGNYIESINYVDLALKSYSLNAESSSLYSLKMIEAINLVQLKKYDEGLVIVDNVLTKIIDNFLEKNIKIENLHQLDYESFNSGNYINIFASASNLYIKKYQQTKDIKLLKKAEATAISASKMFAHYYLKEEYDTYLSVYQSKIAETLLYLCSTKYKTNKSKQAELIDIIEKNESQFLFNQFQKQMLLQHDELKDLYLERNILENKINKLKEDLLLKTDDEKSKLLKIKEQEKKLADKNIKQYLKGFSSIETDFSLQKLQRNLNNNEAVLKFYVNSENVYSILISENSIEVNKIGNIDNIKKMVVNYIQKIKNIDADYQEDSKQLYNLFCENIIAKNLYIIPQNFLNYLPFETLLNNKQKPLIDHKNISYNFSLPLWYALRSHKNKAVSDKVLCFVSDYSNSKIGTKKLPDVMNEVDGILAALKNKATKINKATKNDFIENTNKFSVYHFASHAKLDDKNFELSHLLFSNDEPLFFSDIQKLSLPVQLIVLSSCNTGNGKLVNGEGIMSLSRAFTFAGVRSSVVSYWEVPDKETSKIMIMFYKYLNKGQNKSVALANAKREFLEKYPMKNHPYFWSGFVLNGDEKAIYTSCKKYYYLTGILCLLLFLFFLYKKKLPQFF
ncbi:MAG: CHAT domain-containing tetratricopeptide repeat protein [Chitinophagales bacterium]